MATAIIGGHVALAALAAACATFAWRLHWAAGTLVFVPAVFYIGSRFRALGNITHECSHSTFATTKRANWALGNFVAFFDFTCFEDYRSDHRTHHQFLGDREKDRDYRSRRHLFADRKGTMLTTHVLGPLTLRHVASYIQPVLWSRKDSLALAICRLSFNLGLLALAHFVIGWGVFLAFYVLPYVTAYQIFRYWSDALDHAGIAENEEEVERSRNHIPSSWLLSHLLFPRHDAFHLVHHIYPAIPTAALGKMHQILMSEPNYAAQEHRFGALLRAPASRSRAVAPARIA